MKNLLRLIVFTSVLVLILINITLFIGPKTIDTEPPVAPVGLTVR